MNTFCIPFFQELERDFELLKSTYCNSIEHSQKMIFFLEKKLKQINKWVKTFCFATNEDEIYFFKELKPSLVSKILYYKYILKIESTLPPSKKGKRKHYIKVMGEILLSRYDLFINKKVKTHLTTNLSASELEHFYGNRVRSRLRETLNLIAFNNNSRDKRV